MAGSLGVVVVLFCLAAFSASASVPAAKDNPPGCKNAVPGMPTFKNPNCKVDADGDGYYSLASGGNDHNDEDPDSYPGAPEICGDGIDQDGDGVDSPCACTTDVDGDSFLSMKGHCGLDHCDDGTEGGLGCNSTNAPNMHPGAAEICENGIDEDGDGVDDVCSTCPTLDADGDGHASQACGGGDTCDTGNEAALGCSPDTRATIYPGAAEICGDGIDQNGDGRDETC